RGRVGERSEPGWGQSLLRLALSKNPTRPASLRSQSRRFASAFLAPRTAAEGRLCHPPLRGGIRKPIQLRICDCPALRGESPKPVITETGSEHRTRQVAPAFRRR